MKLVLVCTAVVLLSSAVSQQLASIAGLRNISIEIIYQRANMTPVPQQKLEVYYGDYEVTSGMEVDPVYTIGMPTFCFDIEPGSYYTFIMTTPDCPSSADPYLSLVLMGMYVNLNGSSDGCMELEESCEIATLFGPSPSPGTGTHRYVISVYKQNGMIDTTNEDLCSYQQARNSFSLCDFEKAYDLIRPPVAGCVYYSTYQ